MKKILAFFMLAYAQFAFPQDDSPSIVIALSLNDCVNCNVSIHQIRERIKDQKLTFVLPKQFEADSTLVNTKTGINNFKPQVTIYSDAIFYKYSKGLRSTANIVKNDQPTYTDFLYKLNIDTFVSEYNKPSNTPQVCYSPLRSGIQLIQPGQTLLINDYQLGRWTYYNNKGSYKDIIADSLWIRKAYQTYYKPQEWHKRYNQITDLLKEYPNVLPVINAAVIDNSELIMLTEISFMEPGKDNNINIVKKPFIAIIDAATGGLKAFKRIDTVALSNKNYYINTADFTKQGNVYLFPINSNNDPVKDTKFLATFTENSKTGVLELKEILPATIPENYIKYGLNNNFHNYIMKGNLALLKFGEYIYDWKNKIKYPIPFPNEDFDTLANLYDGVMNGGKPLSYYINDIYEDADTVYILYNDKDNNLWVALVDKKTKTAKKKTLVLEKEKLTAIKNSPGFKIKDNKTLVCLDNNNCLAYYPF